MHGDDSISIWFFIGVSLVVNGVLILAAGIYQYVSPPPVAEQVVLFHLHAGIWWGAILLALGLFWTIRYMPSREMIASKN
jgi:hypothetical protein